MKIPDPTELPEYEVAYRQDGETRTVLVRANGPVAAIEVFRKECDLPDVEVLCVIRQ